MTVRINSLDKYLPLKTTIIAKAAEPLTSFKVQQFFPFQICTVQVICGLHFLCSVVFRGHIQ